MSRCIDYVEREGAKFHYVVCDSYVTMSDGTGIVHIAPAFGEDDARVGRKYDLPFVQLVDAQGCLTDETKWPGVFVKDADKLVLDDLKERRLLVKAPKFDARLSVLLALRHAAHLLRPPDAGSSR